MKNAPIRNMSSSMPVHCLLLLLPFLGAAVVTQKSQDGQGSSMIFDPNQKHTAASLEGAVLNLAALANTPGLDTFLGQIEGICNATIEQRTADWYTLKAQAESMTPDYASCNSTAACNASGYDNLTDYANAHQQCREEQSLLQNQLDGTHSCSADHLAYIAQLRYAKCHDFRTITNAYPDDLPTTCVEQAADGDSNEAYFSRVKTYFDNKYVIWNTQRDECQAVIDQYGNESRLCQTLTDTLENKTQECDEKQGVLDALSCQLAQVHGDCTGFKTCWNRLNAEWTTHYTQNQEEKALIDSEIRAMKRVRCLVDAIQLPQGDIDEALAVCQSSTFDANLGDISYSVTVDTLPPAPNCTDQAHCLVVRPCTPNYVEKYFSNLPINAPAAPSTVECCTRCEFYEACATDLWNPNYKEIVGFDDKTCCLTASWRVGSWSPTLIGDTCPTGCGLVASSYARSVECVSEYGSVVQDSNCAGEKASTSLSCSANPSCASCGDCGWGYEMQGCDTATTQVTGSCVQCQHDLGSYFVSAGNCTTQKCNTNCSIGYYLDGCEGSYGNPGTCVACTPVRGTYITGPGLLVDGSCPTSQCTICSSGEYNSGCSGTNPGTCMPCTGQNNSGIVGFQEYFTGPGTLDNSTSCPKALCDYTKCAFGQVLASCGAGNPGTCVECQPTCSTSTTAASCPTSCHWDSTTNTCVAYQFVVSGALGQCRFSPCLSSQCGIGYYLSGCGGVSNGSCQPCNTAATGFWYASAGEYNANCPSTECQNCSTGEYRSGCGGSSGGTCVACSAPPNGSYSTSHGGLSDSCPSQSCSSLTCAAGKYRFGCGDHSPGTCVSCTGHVDGQYFSGDGGLTDSCPKATCDPSVCPVGYYLKNCGGHLSPASNGTCVPCTDPPVNYYWVTNGGTTNQCQANRCYDLAACPAAYYRTGCGGPANHTGIGYCTACTDLAAGHYYTGTGSLNGSCPQMSCDSLPNCDVGHQRVNCGAPSDPTHQGDCNTSCPAPAAGYYHFQGCHQAKCPSCGAAQYREGCGTNAGNTSDSGICTDCPAPAAGQYFDLSINVGCTAQQCAALDSCATGQYRTGCGNMSAGSCQACDAPPAGFYITGPGVNGNATCPVSSCDLLICQNGQYRAECGSPEHQSQGHCQTCAAPPAGKYYSGHGDSSGNTSCQTHECINEARCPIGYYRDGCGTDVNGMYTNIGDCKKCSSPATGFYFTGDGGITDSCPTASCTDANLTSPCETGYYRINCGGTDHPTSIGTCVRCSPPAADRYIVGHGHQNDSCPTELCDAECFVGEYRAKCGGENDPTSPGYCTNCTAYLRPGHVWLTDGDLADTCTQGEPATTTTTTTVLLASA